MTRVPMMGFNPMPNPALAEKVKGAYMSMGETAENVARKYRISRKEQEEFAVRSHRLATAARQAGKFTDEIIPIDSGKEKVVSDGCIREETSLEALACMRDLKIDLDKTNIDGGAIALGHPLGATGARITGKAAALLKRESKQFALATQCIGGGQGIATILEAA
jgi:acetyl-CoA acetyltransferase